MPFVITQRSLHRHPPDAVPLVLDHVLVHVEIGSCTLGHDPSIGEWLKVFVQVDFDGFWFGRVFLLCKVCIDQSSALPCEFEIPSLVELRVVHEARGSIDLF